MENRYDKYKDSGIAWIGEIPEHWEIKRLKNVSDFNPQNDQSISNFSEVGYLPMERLKNGYMLPTVINVYNLTQGLTFFKENDIVMAKVTPCFENGNIAIAKNLINNCGFGSSELFIFRVRNINREYFFYLLQEEKIKEVCKSTMTGTGGLKRISPTFMRNLLLPIPPTLEQQSIATYLDQKCSEIDELITLQEEMITKLQSYKQSVITEAVTKGLDKNIPLKDSGIEWIGEIPEHWKVKRLKNSGYIYGGLTGKAGNDFNVEESDNYGYFIPFTNIFNNMYIDMNLLGKVKISLNEKQNNVIKNDILFLMSSEDYDGIGKSSLCKENHPQPLYLNSFCKGLRVGNKFNSIFLNYFMNSAVGKYFCQIASNGFIRINLRQDKLLSCPILCPSLSEQQSIADYLDQKCSEIDALISIKQQKIEKLKDYKKSLIFECVTGKRKVS